MTGSEGYLEIQRMERREVVRLLTQARIRSGLFRVRASLRARARRFLLAKHLPWRWRGNWTVAAASSALPLSLAPIRRGGPQDADHR
jgi:hypothetical protein